ncbi:CorA family divalent cation transporter [Staphylococcus simulans]|uniref:CorA family divalent cation transporter n=1 Tax=Staphylococcus simulans TaxID=1286 RepID=UPI000F70C81C|nr:CorA family divalent cation transporter [Staphylococcus simulans]VED59029.1 putative CorA-like Mg2+ transporter protein [Staphylococcus simulans]
MAIRCIYVTPDHEVIATDKVEEVPKESVFTWYDCIQPTKEETHFLAATFELNIQEITASIYTLRRPNLYHDAQNDVEHLLMHAIDGKDFEAEPLGITIDGNHVITVHDAELQTVTQLFDAVKTNKVKRDAGLIALKLLNGIVESYFSYVNAIEDQVFSFQYEEENRKQRRAFMKQVYEIRSEIIKLKRILLPMEQMVNVIQTLDIYDSGQDKARLYHQIYNHLKHQNATLESCEALTDDIKDNNQSYHSSRINSVINVLTIISSIFFPLSFLAGWYGMNFTNMPELHGQYNYFIFIAFSIIIVVVLLLIFKKKKWF